MKTKEHKRLFLKARRCCNARRGQGSIIAIHGNMLLDAGADVNDLDNNGWALLDMTAAWGR
ncbi:MAG: hypothetical protein GDA36_06685 [Rhodobacteraceae bacterium]|nr:hypothetical protein [Paracoccaceae bacterium]